MKIFVNSLVDIIVRILECNELSPWIVDGISQHASPVWLWGALECSSLNFVVMSRICLVFFTVVSCKMDSTQCIAHSPEYIPTHLWCSQSSLIPCLLGSFSERPSFCSNTHFCGNSTWRRSSLYRMICIYLVAQFNTLMSLKILTKKLTEPKFEK